MTLYFDTKVQFLDSEAISTVSSWHAVEPIFAVASYSNERGGSVTIFDDTGIPLRDVTFPVHPTSQATVLTWHPERKILLTGWENGEIHAWFEGKRDFATVNGPHKSPIMLLEFSEKGGRVITADAMGVLTGWRFDGQSQFLTMFNHDLRDPLLHITFRRSIQSASSKELTNLARAAVAGDEAALDQLTSWRPRTAVRNLAHASLQDNYCFYACTQAGILYYISQTGTCTEIVRGDSIPITQILWHPKQDSIVILMEDITIGHYEVDASGQITELDRVKLAGKVSGSKSAITWVAGCALAILTGDLSVRIWDIETNDNYVLAMELPTASGEDGSGRLPASAMEVFTCVAYCRDTHTLSAGTSQGNLYTWRRMSGAYGRVFASAHEAGWQLTNVTPVRGTIKSLTWGTTDTNRPCMMVNCLSNVFILKEQALLARHTRTVWATQRKSNELLLRHASGRETVLRTDSSIIHLALNELHIVVTNGRSVGVYRIQQPLLHGNTVGDTLSSSVSTARSVAMSEAGDGGADEHDPNALLATFVCSFAVDCVSIYLYEQNIVALGVEQVKIFSLSGVILHEIIFNDNEGKPIGVDLLGPFLTIFTLNGFIKLYDVSRHEIKLLLPPKCAYDMFESFGEIIHAKTNATGTHVALTIANEQLVPDGRLHLWNLETHVLSPCEFRSPSPETGAGQCLPVGFYWDTDDARLLACETKPLPKQQQQQQQTLSGVRASQPVSQIHVMFVDAQRSELKQLEVVEASGGGIGGESPSGEQQLIGLCVPHLVVLKRNEIVRLPLRDFKGLEACDLATRGMVLNFSLNVAQENMDQAFSCIRSLRSDTVWMNLARLCVQTGRLDVARVCLGHLRRARSVRALRRAMEDDTLEQEARVAVLAIELDMVSEAEALYKRCGRYDLLNKLYQASGRFDEALEVAEHFDRVHLRNTYHRYAEWLKENGKTQKAIQYYERTSSLMHNISQLLIDDPVALKKYMQQTTDPELLRWWAQYVESSGDMEGAFKIYQRSEDWFAQVRILCFIGQVGRADEIARTSGDRAACYHLGRYYENSGKFAEAIGFYTRAQTYGNAVRICKENDLQDDLWTVACTARARDKASAAAYFEEAGDYRRAVELYHRAGMLHKAVEMAFKSQQPESLQVIASELDAASDPELVARCADFFVGIEQPYKAVQLLANTRQLQAALAVCAEHRVPLTESLAEALTPAKEADGLAEGERVAILLRLGEILQEQGDYHSATKKFTQAGDKVRAMKSLLKSGDTDKIIFFAGMSRHKEVYVMAANYLQALNWQNDAKILKHIVTFYTKGQAYSQLANFYANCAQAEIDEFRDYDKALNALQEAAKCLARSVPPSAPAVLDTLHQAMAEVRRVIELQDATERREYANVIKLIKVRLEDPQQPAEPQPPVRIWDLLTLLVECLVATGQHPEALHYVRELAQRKPDWYHQELLDKAVLDRLVAETGVNLEPYVNVAKAKRPATATISSMSDDEEIQEEFE
ncbi:intraflagellar transport protein 140 homolog [Anopheles ziemanni]|uniref:intraflagellar transport protein 140 homolog n=1 Tax=Anopheles coustani TaxID=139045 RepID=UPI0026584F3D|nr:intraflagellar transport protein 140 homolog [Anopheles coustani]XP_058176039.1 intraflagellar transport protein 140 homolog [Anopheles ziemanni]